MFRLQGFLSKDCGFLVFGTVLSLAMGHARESGGGWIAREGWGGRLMGIRLDFIRVSIERDRIEEIKWLVERGSP